MAKNKEIFNLIFKTRINVAPFKNDLIRVSYQHHHRVSSNGQGVTGETENWTHKFQINLKIFKGKILTKQDTFHHLDSNHGWPLSRATTFPLYYDLLNCNYGEIKTIYCAFKRWLQELYCLPPKNLSYLSTIPPQSHIIHRTPLTNA